MAMKPGKPWQGRMIKIGLATLLTLTLAAALLLVPAPGFRLGAQSKRWTATDHERTNFPLLGKHRSVPCGDCHRDGVIAGTPSACEACHWDRRRDDPYRGPAGHPLRRMSYPFRLENSEARLLGAWSGDRVSPGRRAPDHGLRSLPSGQHVQRPVPGLLFMPPQRSTKERPIMSAPITPPIAGNAISA